MTEIGAHWSKVVNPYELDSGTEAVSPLLHSLVRMARPEAVLEFGSGYSTAWIASALAQNRADFVNHKSLLQARLVANSLKLKDIRDKYANTHHNKTDDCQIADDILSVLGEVLIPRDSPVVPSLVYYQKDYDPILFVWDSLCRDSPYISRQIEYLNTHNLSKLVRFKTDCTIEQFVDAAIAKRATVDLVWDDHNEKLKVFSATFPFLNRNGGMMVIHSPDDNVAAIQDMKAIVAAEHLEAEYLTIRENHKLMQNGCLIIRLCGKQPSPNRGIRILDSILSSA